MAILLSLLTLAIYRPWVPRPFDIRDFSEFLPFLRAPGGMFAHLGALIGYYAHDHGRLNLVSYFGLAVKWSLFGDDTVLWQWARMVEMALVVAGVWLLLRRLAFAAVAALVGASLFIIGRTASEGWTRLTMGEPFGLLLALGALLCAVHWSEDRRRIGAAAGAGALMLLAVLAKEMLLGLLPLVWLIGCCRRADGSFALPTFDAQTRRFLLLSGLPGTATFGVAALVALGGRSEGFTALYGETPRGITQALSLLARPWLLQGTAIGLPAILLPGNTLLLVGVIAGLWTAGRTDAGRRDLRWILPAAASLSVIYAALYLPWPYTESYYAMPFLLGPALLLAWSVQSILDTAPRGLVLVLLLWLALLGATAPGIGQATSVGIVTQQVNGEIASWFAQVPRADRILVARNNLAPRDWMGRAATLRRFTLATGLAADVPPAEDMLCAEAAAKVQNGLGRTVVVSYRPGCGTIPDAHFSVARGYRYAQVWWDGIQLIDDTLSATLVAGPDALAPAQADHP